MMATAPQAETPTTTNSKLNNCDSNSSSSVNSSKLVNGLNSEAHHHHHNNQNHHGHHQQQPPYNHHHQHPHNPSNNHLAPEQHLPAGENNNHGNVMKSQDSQQQNNRGPPHPHQQQQQQHPSYNNSYENHHQQQIHHRMNSEGGGGSTQISNSNNKGMSDPNSNNAGGGPGGGNGPDQGHYPPQQQQPHPHQQPQYQQYPPYRYDQQPPPQQPPQHNSAPPPPDHPGYGQHPGYPPPMRFPGKPMPGGGPGGGPYPVGRGGYPGQSISQPAGPTPTLNQLLQSSGGANPGNSSRYPAPGPPPGSYDPHNPYSKADYNQGPTGWPPPSPRPPLSSYAHPPPPPFQQQQPLYRQSGPGSRSSSGSTGGPPASSPGGPPPPGGPGQQHPGQPYYQGGPPGHGGYPPPPPQSPHYPPPPHPAQPRYPSPGPGMRPPDNQPSHYPGQLPPGMGPEQSNSSSSGLGSSSGVPPPSGSSSSDHPPKSTPPPPPSPSHMGNHGGQPPSPQQSPRSTPHPPPVNSSASNSNSCPPPNSPSQHRPQGGPQGSSPSNNYPPPPDVGEVTGCNSNDSVGGANSSSGGPGGVRPSPSPTGSASSRSMSPAVGNQNIPMPPRPSSQSEGLNSNAPRMSQSPLSTAQGGSYPGQPQMAPPPHHHNMYGGKGHPGIPQGPPPPGHYPGQQQPGPPPHWQGQPGGPPPGPGGYPRHPGPPTHNAGSMMGSPYPPPPGGLPPSQQPLPGNSYPPPPPGQRHPIPNHVPGQPGQYPPYPSQQQYPPPPQPGQQQGWPPGGPGNGPAGGATPPPPSGPPSHNSRSQSHYLKHHLQQKLGYGQQQQGGYPMGPPQSSSSSPSQTPPPGHPHHPPPPDITENSSSNNSNPPNIVSVGPDGANVDEGSQASTISNASGASGGDDGPSMPKLRPEGRGNYPSTPQSNAVPSPGAASMGSAQEDYDMNSPGWPRTPASPGINSHPPPPSEHFRGKNKVKKKADSLNKLYDMDDNPDRRMFLDKLIHFMEDQHNPITSCPTISKNPLDLFRLYFLVKERGGFLEVTNKKTWKDIAGSLGIGASSSAAYTLRKHYTKHLLPFECKFDRGGIDPQPLINQTETTGKKKGKGVAPVPSPGSSNSQDSFPGPNNNTNSSSMDGFSSPTSSNYPSNYPPSGPGGEYPTPNSSTPSPLARPNQQTSQNSSQQHPGGDKSQVSVSNPFDDMPPANTQYPYQQPASRLNYHYPPYSSQPPPPPPSAGYQGPPGSYPSPYGAPEGYGTRGGPPIPPPGMPPHEGPYPGQGYPPPQGPNSGPGSYPGQPSRQMYPPYGENLPQNSGVPPSSSANSSSQSPYHTGPGNPPSSQPPPVPPVSSQSSINSEDNSNRYSSMAPPATNSYSPGRGQYPPPPGAQGASPHAPPPNGYPGQDYYHSQQTDQGYPGIGPPSAPPASGKHMPPPHPNQAMRYPPGKEVPPPVGPGSYPGYPSQSQPGGPPRVPAAYGGPYGPYSSSSSSSGVGSGSIVGRDVRSSPSPSPVAPTPPQIPSSASAQPPTAASPHSSSTPQSSSNKPQPPWIPPPPEGWPGSSGPHYPGQRPPANYPGAPIPGGSATVPPAGGSTTPTPSQSPGVPASVGPSPPTQAPSPQTWGSGRPPTTGGVPQWAQPQQPQGPTGPPSGQQGQTEQSVGASGPGGRYGPSGGSMMSPPPSSSSNSSNQPPWTTPPSSRSGGRPAFPGKPGASPSPSSSSDMYKGYGSPQIQPPTIPTGVPPSVGSPGMMKGPQGQQPQPPPGYHPGQPHHPHQQQIISPQAQQPQQVKKEITFPPDSVEAVTPVFTRRKKLHKNDVAPVEAWRIMMCLKSGLLAETTWALDVLNVLLYDDHSISYFSLTYLPGLLDILLEHLRRALILMFGQSIGIEIVESKEESFKPPPGKCGKYNDEDQGSTPDESDIGMPVRKFPRDCQRTVVLQGSTNYTMVSRIGRKKVGIVAKDEEPFVVPGPRDWDWDEKCRQNETEEMEQLTGTMDVTKHIVTYFSSDLKNVPVVRDLKEESKAASSISVVDKPVEIKVEKPDEDSEELDLKLYQCETKVGKELLLVNSNPGTPKVETKVPVPIAATNSPTPTEPVVIPEKKNCVIGSAILPPASSSPINFSKANLSNKKGRRLDDVLGRLRKDVVVEEDNAMSESPVIANPSGANSESSSTIELPQTDSDSVTNSATNTLAPPSVLENGGESSSNMSMEEDTGACSTPIGGNGLSMDDVENTCDSSRNGRASPRVVQVGELCIRDPACTLKRKRMEDLEDECYTRDESSLFLVSESQDSLARRCLSICNIIRNLTFVPGNDAEFGKCVPFLSLIGKLILLHHEHPVKSRLKLEKKKEDESEPADVVIDEGEDGLLAAALVDIDADSCTSLSNEEEWWWDYVHHLREHVLVMIANISGQMDLSQFSEEISRPILDGLLHWAVCPAAYGQDPFPTLSPGASLSPQRLAIEALCKLSVIQGNVDLLLATPPYSRIERLAQLLCRSLCRTEEQVMREFSLNLLFYLSAADSGVARTIALQNPCISLLISFIEQAENNAMNIASTHGFSVLRENPEAMGTSLDMLRRAAMTLLNLARHPDNRPLFVQHEPRLLQLVMSQILEQKVAAMVAQVLFQCSTPAEGPNSQKYFYSSANTETFYTPLFSRSRSAQQQQQSHIL